jgi:ElaB/YqjD/DUF883 family membrane-anchored ribosome-binding protein
VPKIMRSSNIPEFGDPSLRPLESSVVSSAEKNRSTLTEGAAKLGAAAGKVVFITRRASSTVRHPRHALRDRLNALRDSGRARAEQLRETSAQRAREWTRGAKGKTAELRRQAQENFARAKERANFVRREYPLHVAAVAGGIGFLIGVGLRIWRANREY